MSLPVALTSELTKLSPSAILELFVLDATALGGDILRFHSGTNGLSQNIVWQGQTYVRYPIAASGFEITGQGSFPRPKIQVANIFSAITQVVLQYGDLLGAKVTRKRTMAKFLDAVNFPGGVNATEDQTAEFMEDVYFVDRKSGEDRDTVEFELAASLDLAGVALPRRQVIQNVCVWKYRGAECGYTGAPVYEDSDSVITTASTTEGQAVLDTFAAMNAAQSALDSAQSALTAATLAMSQSCEYRLIEARLSAVTGAYPFSITDGVKQQSGTNTPFWDGAQVTFGLTYRMGDWVANYFPATSMFKLEYWGPSTSCSSDTATYNSALSTRDTAAANLSTAQANFAAALAALPSTDPLYRVERCGKRLSSCKVRFGSTGELPFGSFPASGLFK